MVQVVHLIITSNSGTTYDITDGTTSTSTYTVKEYDYLPNELVTTTNTDPYAIVKMVHL